MYCSQCGANLNNDNNYCHNCGSKINFSNNSDTTVDKESEQGEVENIRELEELIGGIENKMSNADKYVAKLLSGKNNIVDTAKNLAKHYLTVKNSNNNLLSDIDICHELLDIRYKLLTPKKFPLGYMHAAIDSAVESNSFNLDFFVWFVLVSETDLLDTEEAFQTAVREVISISLDEFEGLPRKNK